MKFIDTVKPGNPKRLTYLSLIAVVMFLAWLDYAVGTNHMPVKNTAWALTPPLIAISLALITKEVYSSLFLGMLTGALLNADFNPVGGLNQLFPNGIMTVLSDKWNVGILVFLVILGTMVQLMNRTGGSAAFGAWAAKHIKGRAGAQLSTLLLGCLIFVDDYFNCLTVGSVMRPVTDKHRISRAKLAYLIDSTAAPICIIAPISSWAAAVSGFVKGTNGISVFVQSIPFNFYALLTLLMIISISTCMAGAVCGDHCSPISDTTIMSSAGAQCDHLSHVTTQLSYALTAASVSFFTFLVAGFTKSALISLLFGVAVLFLLLLFIRYKCGVTRS